MLGTRAAGTTGELAWGSLTLVAAALRTRSEAAGPASGAAGPLEDGPAALNSGACGIHAGGGRGCGWRRWRSLVDGTRPGLGHDDFANLRRRRLGNDRRFYGGRL